MKPRRVQLSRRKGFKLPPKTVVVSRPTKWGNPFIVGQNGTRQECVEAYRILVDGLVNVSVSVTGPSVDQQEATLKYLADNIQRLKGKHLACWCSLDVDCHADVLLALANGRPLPRYGIKMTRLG